MKERLKDLKQGALSVREYKDRFDELVEYFPDLSDKDKQIFFVTVSAQSHHPCVCPSPDGSSYD